MHGAWVRECLRECVYALGFLRPVTPRMTRRTVLSTVASLVQRWARPASLFYATTTPTRLCHRRVEKAYSYRESLPSNDSSALRPWVRQAFDPYCIPVCSPGEGSAPQM
jgi:hypothetical protein